MTEKNITEETLKKRWGQMEEMNEIWDRLPDRQKGYLEGCMNTIAAINNQKQAG